MRQKSNTSIFYNIDWVTVFLYLILIIMGWMNIYSAVYNEDHNAITDMSQKYGKQMLWIGSSLLLALIILIIDRKDGREHSCWRRCGDRTPQSTHTDSHSDLQEDSRKRSSQVPAQSRASRRSDIQNIH